jgi:hypothetical protein
MSMNISQSLLPEFDMEIANTRKTLERVPEGRPDFRPHPKSMTLSRLASRKELLAKFDDEVKKARAALVTTSDETMMKTWTLKNAGKTVLAFPPCSGSRRHPATLAGAAVTLAAVAALAAGWPAWRASRIDPAVVLRSE